jgi:hypothetical protein
MVLERGHGSFEITRRRSRPDEKHLRIPRLPRFARDDGSSGGRGLADGATGKLAGPGRVGGKEGPAAAVCGLEFEEKGGPATAVCGGRPWLLRVQVLLLRE